METFNIYETYSTNPLFHFHELELTHSVETRKEFEKYLKEHYPNCVPLKGINDSDKFLAKQADLYFKAQKAQIKIPYIRVHLSLKHSSGYILEYLIEPIEEV